jgi:hypothetical protein
MTDMPGRNCGACANEEATSMATPHEINEILVPVRDIKAPNTLSTAMQPLALKLNLSTVWRTLEGLISCTEMLFPRRSQV